MASPEHSLYALSLGSESRGDRFLAHRLYTQSQGPLNLLARRSSQPNRQIAIDLFDEGDFRFELKQGQSTGFLKEAQIVRKRTKLSRNYQAFEAASRFANIVLSNPVPDESIEPIFELLSKGLDSWESGMDPSATYLKCLYVYCRQEGYPVREEWAARLTREERGFVARVLNQPLRELRAEAVEVKNAIANLEHYILHHTHIRIERPKG